LSGGRAAELRDREILPIVCRFSWGTRYCQLHADLVGVRDTNCVQICRVSRVGRISVVSRVSWVTSLRFYKFSRFNRVGRVSIIIRELV
jgi:hypothetical protein